ncbi:sodium/hydrogen exchanger 9B1 isoform X1 [Zalophus californianus]|uniref:Sodium/hydrogen exchanger 9B1 isoform X1 n=3 Tax=Zalophus californianus TaxID=9704 RepID=A0A6J2DHR1_ZALCA|nr:sodium/hydrogen exchanger 9B1 isoform X1 [Zalophus californianus]XP_027454317.1 sodium/hydrogen exchanger 9B1 isoform X1 [Zalophus californianus]
MILKYLAKPQSESSIFEELRIGHKFCCMYTTESQNEHLEDKNTPSSTTPQILKDSSISEHEETKETVLSKTEEKKPQMEKKYSCPLQGKLNKLITNGVAFFMVWCVVWSFSGPEVLPGGNLFGLLIIFYSAIIGGKLLEFIRIPSVPQIPPLLGMLLAGFTVRNVPFLSNYIHVNNTWSSTLRNTALTVILIQAGLGLDPQALRHMKRVCLRLAIGPCLMEACSTAVVSHFLMNFPWQWGFLLGFVLGAVSPAVVVPSMLLLQENGYGINKGIPTLLIAASSLDDIIAVTGFSTCLSIVFSSGGILNNVLASFRDVLIGALAGAVLGIFVQYFPSGDQTKLPLKRAFLILSMCVTAVLGSHHIGLHAAGGLCTLALTFVAGINWSTEKVKVQRIIKTTWYIFQPLLFGLVGSEVSVASLKSNAIGICVATMSLALLVRISFTFVLMCFAGFSFKEKIFIALSWMPKATVQAVLGPLALETARSSAPHLEPYSKDVMTVAFLAILITAPNGALIIGVLGPKVLTHHEPNKIDVELTKLELH